MLLVAPLNFPFNPTPPQVCSSSTSYSFPWYSLCLSRIFYACAAAGGIFLPSFLPPPRLLSPPFLLKPHCFSWLNTHSEYRQRGKERVERGREGRARVERRRSRLLSSSTLKNSNFIHFASNPQFVQPLPSLSLRTIPIGPRLLLFHSFPRLHLQPPLLSRVAPRRCRSKEEEGGAQSWGAGAEVASSLSLLAEVLLLRLSCLSSQGREGRRRRRRREAPPSHLRAAGTLSLLRRGNERRRIDAPLSSFLTANF